MQTCALPYPEGRFSIAERKVFHEQIEELAQAPLPGGGMLFLMNLKLKRKQQKQIWTNCLQNLRNMALLKSDEMETLYSRENLIYRILCLPLISNTSKRELFLYLSVLNQGKKEL